jgi:hypothetical protein
MVQLQALVQGQSLVLLGHMLLATAHVEARMGMAWWWPMPPCMGAAKWPVALANGFGHLQ